MSGAHVAEHYDRITEVWTKWVMGQDLHFGFFENATDTLEVASARMTSHLAASADLQPGLTLLDVGCGVGTAAMYLAEQHRCAVTGISTSHEGISIGRETAARRGLTDRVELVLADAMSNGLADESFDRVFSLESTHLMHDKQALFDECYRVLRPGGRLALCDVTLVGRLESDEQRMSGYRMMGHSEEVARRMVEVVDETLNYAFGSRSMCHYSVYAACAREAGFVDVEIFDVSKQVKRTLEHWCRNASANWDAIEASVGRRYLDDFFMASLHMSFRWGQHGGYVVMVANRP
jgi:cyclopropane fatty-acyl-phospholipid synthase-like methyltransferase